MLFFCLFVFLFYNWMSTCRCIIDSGGQQILESAKYASDIHRKLTYFHNELLRKITNVSPEYKDSIDWKTLLTTQLENLYVVSHFKHVTFSALQYAIEFGTISKESLKRITKWGNVIQGSAVYDSTSL